MFAHDMFKKRRALAFRAVVASAGMIATAGVASATIVTPGTWQEPVGGWKAVYDADSGLLPSALSDVGTDKVWQNHNNARTNLSTGTGFSLGGNASFVTDASEPGSTLQLNTGSGDATFDLVQPPGSGGAGDLMTFDMRFKNGPSPGATFALSANLSRPPSPAQLVADPTNEEQRFQIDFREVDFRVLGASAPNGVTGQTWRTFSSLGQTWHDIRVLWNSNGGGAQFYLDGSGTPLTFHLSSGDAGVTTIYPKGINASQIQTANPAGLGNNHVAFGDMTSGTASFGDIAYARVTNTELVGPSALVPNLILGDVNHDEHVNAADFVILATQFNQTTTANWAAGATTADLNNDGVINSLDFNILANNFGVPPGASPALGAVVPEPVRASLVTLVFGAAALHRRRSRVCRV